MLGKFKQTRQMHELWVIRFVCLFIYNTILALIQYNLGYLPAHCTEKSVNRKKIAQINELGDIIIEVKIDNKQLEDDQEEKKRSRYLQVLQEDNILNRKYIY
ncbi:transmembrane protein, putative (macronuclear) [Tetrahymena thermophila SB210]|uniref:Transmembrane protein, putative n=1 Tax=Tetrahymena thermophila (strain SB210) TaxID=312017 RepID=W7XCA7_TETTS|nr:transmembrane protein, putative [Tetrahymena thermophila SB210]EWS71366.1 transmembrane protein, putative [Tetrahymena thermophila SB210]|eukprot:XP_012656099.1 transmembrane protein, putative [Tetrahymena thermophila SB210]